MAAYGYVRVSTEEQGRSGLSLEHQQRKVAGYADLHDLTLVDTVADVASAKTLKRDGLTALLARLRSGDVVIVAKLDRLTRSVRDLADLLDVFARRGASLVSVGEHLDTGSAAGRLVLNVMASVSQWEREAIAERTRSALAIKRTRGEHLGTAPYGYRLMADGTHLEPCPDEQRVLMLAEGWRAEGYTQQAVADALNARGILTRSGQPWRQVYVARMLKPTGVQATAAA